MSLGIYEAGYEARNEPRNEPGYEPGYKPGIQLHVTSPFVTISISTVTQNTKDHHIINFKHNNTKIYNNN